MRTTVEQRDNNQVSLSCSVSRLRRQVEHLEQEINVLRQFAFHDALTGLPNRRLLQDRINQAITQASRRNSRVALLFIDLDGFKQVNDRFGHCIGDKLLQSVSARLLDCVREADSVCRYGGDEFVILLPEIGSKQNAKALAANIQSRLSEVYCIDKLVINLSASIGLAFYLNNNGPHNDLIRQADLAMYVAKVRAHAKLPASTQ